MRVRIRAYEFGTTPAEFTCQDVLPGSACKADFWASGSPIIMHFACSADFTAKAEAMRGTFYRTSSTGTTSDLALEMR